MCFQDLCIIRSCIQLESGDNMSTMQNSFPTAGWKFLQTMLQTIQKCFSFLIQLMEIQLMEDTALITQIVSTQQ